MVHYYRHFLAYILTSLALCHVSILTRQTPVLVKSNSTCSAVRPRPFTLPPSQMTISYLLSPQISSTSSLMLCSGCLLNWKMKTIRRTPPQIHTTTSNHQIASALTYSAFFSFLMDQPSLLSSKSHPSTLALDFISYLLGDIASAISPSLSWINLPLSTKSFSSVGYSVIASIFLSRLYWDIFHIP